MHAGARLGSQWTTRRKQCVQGPLRRAHPASGATWNVQVVRGKVTSRCLWHACRALSLGLLLMVLGAAMATIGYYADQLSVGQEVRGNATVRVKNESRGFHLNNLSYAGPIVMGVGGFIVVAACVMTFEARDSAAKVMPARYKSSGGGSGGVRAKPPPRRSAASQTSRGGSGIHGQPHLSWDHHLGLYRTDSNISHDRRALTHAFMQFSKNLGCSEPPLTQRLPPRGSSARLGPSPSRHAPRMLRRSGSEPELVCARPAATTAAAPVRTARRPTRLLQKPSLTRQALSVDETHARCTRYSRESLCGSQGSMALDLHGPALGAVTLRVRDRSRAPSAAAVPGGSRPRHHPPVLRSDTARRHMLARQRQIDDEEHNAHAHWKTRDGEDSGRKGGRTQREALQRRLSNASDSACARSRQSCKASSVPRRSASSSPRPRRSPSSVPPPVSLDLPPPAPPDLPEDPPEEADLSPDLVDPSSEYHTICEEQSKTIHRFPTSTDSRDSRSTDLQSTETGTLHTAEVNCSEDEDLQVETPTSSQTENDAEADLTEDLTPTYNSDLTSSKCEENDASTVIDLACCEDS